MSSANLGEFDYEPTVEQAAIIDVASRSTSGRFASIHPFHA